MDHRDGPTNACCYRDQCHGDREEVERLRRRLSGALQHLEEAREALAKITKHRLRGRKTQGALLAEAALKGSRGFRRVEGGGLTCAYCGFVLIVAGPRECCKRGRSQDQLANYE